MKVFMKSKKVATLAVVLLCTLAALVFFRARQDRKPKFRDLTVELGTDTVSIRDFLTPDGSLRKAAFVTDPGEVDLNKTGTTPITFRHGRKQETVTLTVQDTTPPEAVIPTALTLPADEIPEAASLVTDIQDMSTTRVYYLEEPELTEDYADQTVTIVVEDASGNKTQGICTLTFRWLREELTLELGTPITAETLLLCPQRDEALLEDTALEELNQAPAGIYTLVSTAGSRENRCTVTLQDTKGPDLKVNEVKRRRGHGAKLEDFIESVYDPSGVADVRMIGEFDVRTPGTYPVTIEAEDTLGHVTTVKTSLLVSNDWHPPVIEGDLSPLSVEKHSAPDFLEGLTVKDDQPGQCELVCDTGKLNLDAAGTYYITYYAYDQAGNKATAKRQVSVNPDAEDTAALVKKIAESLSDDPEVLRNYVRGWVGYTTEWGGEDPVWFGFTRRAGNCFVHAQCLKALFDYKGIENQLIWVTNKSHYWLLVKIGDGWKHIDPTPGTRHSRYSLMNDEQRLATLSGRTWDTDQWPACE